MQNDSFYKAGDCLLIFILPQDRNERKMEEKSKEIDVKEYVYCFEEQKSLVKPETLQSGDYTHQLKTSAFSLN